MIWWISQNLKWCFLCLRQLRKFLFMERMPLVLMESIPCFRKFNLRIFQNFYWIYNCTHHNRFLKQLDISFRSISKVKSFKFKGNLNARCTVHTCRPTGVDFCLQGTQFSSETENERNNHKCMVILKNQSSLGYM